MIRTERSADGTVEAVSDVRVGTERRTVRVPLGVFDGPIGRTGLRNVPIVVVVSRAPAELVRAGAERAGKVHVVEAAPSAHRPLGARLIELVADSAEAVFTIARSDEVARALTTARALGGRPLPVLPFDDPVAARTMLEGCDVELDIALPSIGDAAWSEIRRVADELGIFDAHHPIEVDPRPALRDEGAIADRTLHDLAAAATGVLAGRIAAGNRRWR